MSGSGAACGMPFARHLIATSQIGLTMRRPYLVSVGVADSEFFQTPATVLALLLKDSGPGNQISIGFESGTSSALEICRANFKEGMNEG